MSDVEEDIPAEDVAEEEPAAEEAPSAPSPAPKAAASPKVGSRSGSVSSHSGVRPHVPKKEKPPVYSAGKPSKFDKNKLMASDGIVPLQSGSNKWASQAHMTGFGMPRDTARDQKTHAPNLKEITDEKKLGNLRTSQWAQTGTNEFASQKGMTGYGMPRDVLSKPKGTGGVTAEMPEEKVRASDGIVRLQSGTNKLASQQGMTGFGMPRLLFNAKVNPEQHRNSQGFIHLQMGTNRFADQSKLKCDLGKARGQVTHATDDCEARKPIPHDETTLSKQTSGWKEGASQAGTRGFGPFRLQTMVDSPHQDRKSQGLIPYQMGINWAESQTGKYAFGTPRLTFTPYTDDNQQREELPDNMARLPYVPFWSGAEDFASQSGMTCPGMPRDVTGKHIHRLW